ncbi:hypothetical protein SARC_08571 [Sphaeroforma arctica JP610]|uniref:RxLR effector protein n=1 Tax=Sphaeroforma arctica JP610 TaxID=667725 RepID=A0A0L0FQH0_9EUKA|nr:hypothetical protein SARC_08571 [Sphaeroforma arctica JP610]KNC79030.1 hypothetical protein SARC_08571 [Sphaeroforma arctica JP610]|eukprot:XP_014152932.1 hypothetical protein SARC_08571 [Sphaeroforma arctica JP610]
MTMRRTIIAMLLAVSSFAVFANAMYIPGAQHSKSVPRPVRHISNIYDTVDTDTHKTFGDSVGKAMMGVTRQSDFNQMNTIVQRKGASSAAKSVNDNRRRDIKRTTMKHVSHESKPLTAQMAEIKRNFEMRLGDHFSEQSHSEYI